MNKKGTHIDWAISMGIFLVYVLSMFVLIQPGVEKFYKEDNLLKIVEEGLKSKDGSGGVFYEITRVPIYVESIKNAINHKESLEITLPDFKEEGLLSKDDFNLLFRTSLAVDEQAPFMIIGDKLRFTPLQAFPIHKGDTYTFWLYYSEGKYPDDVPYEDEGLVPEEEVIINVGSKEKIIGIAESIIGNFINCANLDAYEELKESWKFPKGKEFAIYYVESETIPYDLSITPPINICNSVDNVFVSPSSQTDVYVKEFSDWLLNPYGELSPIIINVKVW